MQRVVWLGLDSLLIATALAAVTLNRSEPPPSPVVVPTVVPSVAMPIDAAAMLKALGEQQLTQLAMQYRGFSKDSEIAAFDACVRPTATQREAFTMRVQAATNEYATIRFGCMDPGGLIVDVSFDAGDPTRRVGNWRTLLVTDKTITIVESMQGLATDYWMEWAGESTQFTFALVDFDGDGVRDRIIALTDHEGGSHYMGYALSIRHSRNGSITTIGSILDTGRPTLGLASAATTPVLRYASEVDGPVQYICVVGNGLAAAYRTSVTRDRALVGI